MRASLINLARLLAELFPDESFVQVVLADAGFPVINVNLEGAALVIWQDVLSYAERIPGMTSRILTVAGKYFDGNEKLAELVQAYEDSKQDRPMDYSFPPTGGGRVDTLNDKISDMRVAMESLNNKIDGLTKSLDEMHSQLVMQRWMMILFALVTGLTLVTVVVFHSGEFLR